MLERFIRDVIRTSSFYYTIIRNKIDWDEFNWIRDGLWVGKLPTIDGPLEEARDFDVKLIAKILEKTPKMPLELVVSVVEEDELLGEGFAFVETIKPEQWDKNGIKHHLLKMVDFTADVNFKEAVETVKKILEVIKAGKSVYVHCKAGRSRSVALSVVVFILSTINSETGKKFTLDEALEILSERRKQADVDDEKRKMAARILKLIDDLDKLFGMLQSNSSLSHALAKFAENDRNWLVVLLSKQELQELIKDKNELQCVFKYLSPAYRVYLYNQLDKDFIIKLFSDDKSEYDELALENIKWMEESLKDILSKHVTIINSVAWDTAGTGMFHSKIPTGINNMQNVVKPIDVNKMNLNQSIDFLDLLSKQFKADNSPTRSPKSNRLFDAISTHVIEPIARIPRKDVTKKYYRLFNVSVKNTDAKNWNPHLFMDQLNELYAKHYELNKEKSNSNSNVNSYSYFPFGSK